MDKRKLSDRTLQSLKPRSELYDVWDSTTPGFGVRISPSGRKTFVLAAHVPGKSGTRRALGEYGVISLAEAREKAAEWKKLIKRGVDPADEEARQRAAEQRKRANTLAAVSEDFIRKKLPRERRGKEAERDIRREFLPVFGGRPITEITASEIRGLIKHKAESAPVQARNLLALIKRLMAWAVDADDYGLTESPAAQLKASKIIEDPKLSRERTLSDDEIFALWRAAGRTWNPHGPVYELLILSGLRLNEAADASWPEFDLKNGLWTIPAERMKGKNGKARPHVVPLTPDILAIIAKLPPLQKGEKKGEYLFSKTYGRSPIWMNDKVKKRIDKRMLRTLRALARKRGEDPARVTLQHWTNHDIRRSVATKMAELGVLPHVVEAVLNHVSGHKAGVAGVYNRAVYATEKREALELWAAKVRSLMQPAPSNVVQFRATNP